MADAAVLDVFNNDAFSVINMTDALNRIPFVPQQAGTAVTWEESGITTTTAGLEMKDGTLQFVPTTPRGGPGASFADRKRKMKFLQVPHYQIDDAVYPDEVQGVREFGQPNQLRTVQSLVDSRNLQHTTQRLDPTMEYVRLSALKGIVVTDPANMGGLIDLFDLLGVSQPSEVDFNLDSTSNDGSLRQVCAQVKRSMATALGGLAFTGIRGFCSASFFDALIKNAEVRATYLQQIEAAQLRNGYVYQPFNFGDILWEEYRGAVGGTSFIEDNKCNLFPIGVTGMYRTIFAPADYEETVNTIGVARYQKQWREPSGKRINIEIQSNVLPYVTRPEALIQGKLT